MKIPTPLLNPNELSPAVWAYIGDAVYELYIRNMILASGPMKTGNMHRETTRRVRASYQAAALEWIEPYLTEAEREIVKRGRNIKSGHVPAGATVLTYRHSTALEALIGYLYLLGSEDRLMEILRQIGEANHE